MWSSESIDLENAELVLDHPPMLESAPRFQPSPYTFTRLQNGKKTPTDATSITPPSWLLLDHTIAVIWSMFNMDPKLQPLSIDDLKWAYEFLKEIKNQNGANPPDVKVCLKEIEDRLIHLYSRLTNSESEEFNSTEDYGESVIEDTTTSYIDASYFSNDLESKFDSMTISTKNSSALMRKSSSKELRTTDQEETPRLDDFPFLEEDSDWCGEGEINHDEEVEKYVLKLFEDEKKEALRVKNVTKSMIPTVKKKPTPTVLDVASKEDARGGVKKEKKTSKKVHCIAQMRSLQFQKSMKVKHTNGEQEAYSKLKAEILTIKPNTSQDGMMKILEEWRSEQVHNQHKKVRCLEEYMKTVNHELKPTFQENSSVALKELDKEKYFRSRRMQP